MKKTFSAILLLCAAICVSFAQSGIRVQAPNIVAADEQFNVTFIIEGDDAPSDFKWDLGGEFQLVWGPQKGTSTSISIVNGKRTRSSQTTYTYILMPKSTGKFTLPVATAVLDGKDISSPAPSVEVVSNGAKPSGQSQSQSQSQSQPQSQPQASTGDIASSDLFLRLTLSRTSVVVGEPVTATLKLFQRVNIAGFEDVKFPTFNGFWSQEVLNPSNIEFHRENVNDNIYNAAVLRSWVIIPQQSGDISIDPSELVCLVNVRTQSNSRSIFDSFFEDDYRTIRKRVLSDRCVVHVSPLPSGAPASFGGGVGTFTMTAKLAKDSLKTHDASSLLVTVSGKGNVSLLDAPKINFPPDFDVYDVKISDNSDKSSGKTSGSKTFEYPFIPRSHGDFTIDPVEYSYYDVNSHKYVTLSTPAMELKVQKGAESDQPASSSGQIVSGVSRKDVRNLGSDIRFIVTKAPSFSRQGKSFCFSGLFWLLVGLILAAAAAAWVLLRSWAARKADVAGSRNRGAVKMARRRLSQAGEFLNKNLYTAFYEELHKALLGYVSDKLNMDMSEMSKDNIAASLVASGVSESLAGELTGLLDACEFARYAPDSGHEAMNAHYENALSVIASIDGSMKKKMPNVTKGAAVAMALMLSLSVVPEASAAGQDTDALWTAGTEAYVQGHWSDALESWNAIVVSGVESADLYYNMGNAYFKQDDIAHAVLYYEKALKLDPSSSDARFNLEFANQFVQDKIESVPEFFLATWLRKVSASMSSTAWAVLFLLLLAAAAAMCVAFLLGSSRRLRMSAFYSGIVTLILSLSCLGFAAGQKSASQREDSAIIVRPVASVKSSPGAEAAKDLFVLHEGTRVKLLDVVGKWQNIELADGRQGWVMSSDMEII